MPKKTLSPRDKSIIYALHLEGKSQTRIAQLYEVSQSTISMVIKEMSLRAQIPNNSPRAEFVEEPRRLLKRK